MPKSIPVRIDHELYEDASITADLKSRSIAQQIVYWARIGRAFEAAPDVSDQRISRVLGGTASYDDLTGREQAVVRAEWDRRIESRVEDLRLDEVFAREGKSYVELDEQGRVVRRDPEKAGSES